MDQVCKHCGSTLNTEYYKLHSANNPDWLYCSGKCLDEFDKKTKDGTDEPTLSLEDEIDVLAEFRTLVVGCAMTVGVIVCVCVGVNPFELIFSIIDAFLMMLFPDGC